MAETLIAHELDPFLAQGILSKRLPNLFGSKAHPNILKETLVDDSRVIFHPQEPIFDDELIAVRAEPAPASGFQQITLNLGQDSGLGWELVVDAQPLEGKNIQLDWSQQGKRHHGSSLLVVYINSDNRHLEVNLNRGRIGFRDASGNIRNVPLADIEDYEKRLVKMQGKSDISMKGFELDRTRDLLAMHMVDQEDNILSHLVLPLSITPDFRKGLGVVLPPGVSTIFE